MIGITAHDILSSSGRYEDRLDWVSPAVERNAHNLAPRATAFLMKFGAQRTVNSGFRDIRTNQKVGGAMLSNHLFGSALDFEDMNGKLNEWLLRHEYVLEECGLWAEHPKHTKTWCHIQDVPYPGWKPGMTRFFFVRARKP